MTRKDKLILTLGIMLVVGALIIFGFDRFFDYSRAKKQREIAENSIIVHSSTDAEYLKTLEVSTQTDAEAWETPIDVLGKDQDVASVTTYKNVLEIPQYDILVYIYPDVSDYSLAMGVGKYPETKDIGAKGNCAVAGHSSNQYRAVLNMCQYMKILDTFNVYDANGVKHQYYVTGMYTVNPYDVSVLYTKDDSISQFTMVTCNNNGNTRLIIEGKELNQAQLDQYIKNAKTIKQNEMLSLNNSIEITDIINVNNYLLSLGIISNDEFYINYFTLFDDRVSTVDTLYRPILFNRLNKKEHIYNSDFQMDLGVRFNKED